MKKQILLCLLAGLLSLPFMYATSHKAASNEIQDKTTSKIVLEGKLQSKGSGFRSGGDPIIAELQESTLFLLFQRNVDVLQVTITGIHGNVHTTFVNTATQTTLNIPLAGLPTGNYTISFSNERGMMWGEFEI